jgi:hypothetical protein
VKLRWIVISYFFIAGGITVASGLIAAAWLASGTIDLAALGRMAEAANRGELTGADLPELGRAAAIAGILAFAAGAALGGFFAGRASPHRSFIEPAIAAALVVGAFVALIYSTPMGSIAVGLIRSRVEMIASILAATGLCAGLIGAVLGELADFGTERVGVVRQSGVGFLLTTGALFSAALFAAVLVINDAAEEALRNYFAWQQSGGDRPLVEIPVGRLVAFAILATTAAAAIGGAVNQLAARSRAVAASGIGAGLAIGAVALSVAPLFPRLEWLSMASFGGAVVLGLLASASAALVCAARRMTR